MLDQVDKTSRYVDTDHMFCTANDDDYDVDQGVSRSLSHYSHFHESSRYSLSLPGHLTRFVLPSVPAMDALLLQRESGTSTEEERPNSGKTEGNGEWTKNVIRTEQRKSLLRPSPLLRPACTHYALHSHYWEGEGNIHKMSAKYQQNNDFVNFSMM